MTHPLDDDNGLFLVLDNSAGQSSLWPHFLAVPAGWTAVFGPERAERCRDFITAHAPA
ncbi:MbtH family protein [Paracidovorax cattleyae]|uniref:MbtH protein n=1 Tax=Paracidovorax cattleyae TaxID=80868 RepID=A0A1H0P8C9_9BURK|nr:MbtH family protein [Paracidovorax cattleyae]AVS76077.1 MbtH family protein [Paracidovorax cattleyae]MBF9265851.1 MbtH family protein [Paracidovorax cattleyae]SDP01283.1 MbtH protein [Paracidovorax cattleyae]